MPTHSLTNVPEQSHEAMRASVPGREPSASEVPIVGIDHTGTHEPIPGERDAETLTHREVGAVSAPFNGTDNVPQNLDTVMDDETRIDRVLEGGGRDALRHFLKQHGAR